MAASCLFNLEPELLKLKHDKNQEGCKNRRATIRSSRSQMLFKIGVFKNFANFTGKHLCWSLFLKKLHSSTGVFL